MDEADDELRHVVARRGLGREDERARHGVVVRVRQQTVVEDDDVEREQQLALVLVQALHLDVEDRIGIKRHAKVGAHPVRKDALVGALDLRKAGEEGLVLCKTLELPEFVEVGDPVVADLLGDQLRKRRIRLQEPTTGRDAVRDVVEVVRHEFVEVLEERLLEDVGVQLGNAVDARGADDRKVGHTHIALAVLVDQRHAGQAVLIAGVDAGDLAEEAPVDLVDDLEVTREQALHHRHGPLLERLGEDRVVRVARRAAREVPGRIPVNALLVDEDAHELGDDERGVRLVQVDEGLLGQLRPVVAVLAETTEDIRQRAAHEEVLLAETELLAGHRVVVRIEDLREVLGENLALDGLDIRALVELRERELVRRLRAPEAQRVDGVFVADDREIVGDALHGLGADPAPFEGAMLLNAVDIAAELDDARVLGTRHLPGIAVLEPAVGFLDLLSIDDALAEDAVVVAKTIAHAREIQRTQRVEEAGGQAAKTAIAETGVDFEVTQGVPVETIFLEGLGAFLVELEVDDVVAEETSDKELQREIGDATLVLGVVTLLGVHPPLDDPITDRVREGRVLVARRRLAVILGQRVAEVPGKVLFQTLHRIFDPAVSHLLRHVRLFCLTFRQNGN